MEIINTFNPIMQKYGNKIGVFCGWLETFRCVWNDFLSRNTGLLTNQACHSTALKVLLCPVLFLFMCFLGVKCFLIQIRSAECYRYL